MDEVSLIIRRARRGNCKNIDLSHRSLTSIPNDLLKVLTLESLNLSHNLIVSIPDNISDLENLAVLDLSYNNISSLSQGLSLLRSLRQLNLESNPINLGNLLGTSLTSALSLPSSSQFSQMKPVESASVPKRPGTSEISHRARPKEEEKTESNRGSLQGVSQVEYSELSLGEIVSQGGFSVVHRGVWRGTQVAIKVIVDPVITPELRQEFENEIMMLNYLRHPHTILLMAASFKPPHFTVVSEYINNGTLYDLLHRSREEISVDRKLNIMSQICEAFVFYHMSGVVHRDLKSMNVLLDCSDNVKICDFGLARFKSELNKGSMQFSGTPAYMAPELFRKQSYDEKVDVFAFGTLFWETFAREVPYDGLEPGDIRDRIVRGDNKLEQPVNCPRKFSSLIELCRQSSPQARPSFQDIAKHMASL